MALFQALSVALEMSIRQALWIDALHLIDWHFCVNFFVIFEMGNSFGPQEASASATKGGDILDDFKYFSETIMGNTAAYGLKKWSLESRS